MDEERLSLEAIREFWRRQAVAHGQSSDASWSDQPVIEMEIRQILGCIHDGDTILDVGCANGFSTLAFAMEKKISILGIDYIPEMIEQARLRHQQLAGRLRGEASFETGTILQLKPAASTYDKVVVIRVLINLENRDNQRRALKECARMLKPGGHLILSEATVQGWRQLNAFRQEWGLPDIPMPGFNTYLDEEELFRDTAEQFEPVRIVNFSSSYFIGTRVIKPLLAKLSAVPINVADPHMHWNRWIAQMPSGGDYGTQKLIVLKKR